MKAIKGTFKVLYFFLAIILLLTGAMAGYYSSSIEDNYKITKGASLSIDTLIPVTAEHKGIVLNECDEINGVGNSLKVDFKLFGIIPIKSTTVEVVEDTYVAVLGSPFGIKLFTDGVLVVDLQEIETKNGSSNPAKIAGIKTGDYIVSLNGIKVKTNEDLAEIFSSYSGEPISVKIRRQDKIINLSLTPALCREDGKYKAGIWVKDSSAGIGTLTFYCPYNNMLCGLGHAIYDTETKTVMSVGRGELVGAQIISVVKGTKGVPGELKGKLNYTSIGNLDSNNTDGVYGRATCKVNCDNLTPIAHKQEVKDGGATIITTVDSSGPRSFSCEIKVGNYGVNDTVQDMTVTITDKELLSLTGGIVQGMSGSPIIQNGKLIGSLTHVLIDDPTKGYAIFAENMLETAQSVAESNKLKEAS